MAAIPYLMPRSTYPSTPSPFHNLRSLLNLAAISVSFLSCNSDPSMDAKFQFSVPTCHLERLAANDAVSTGESCTYSVVNGLFWSSIFAARGRRKVRIKENVDDEGLFSCCLLADMHCENRNKWLRQKRKSYHQSRSSEMKSQTKQRRNFSSKIHTSDVFDTPAFFVRGGGDVESNYETRASEFYTKRGHRHRDGPSSQKRGTRTTGAGASRRNPSVFSMDQQSKGDKTTYQRWTTAALAGDVLNRQSSAPDTTKKGSKSKKYKSTHENESFGHSNPMMGRLWAKRTNHGLIFKFPSAEGSADPFLYVELSERILNRNSTDVFSSTNQIHNEESHSISSMPIIEARFISTDEVLIDNNVTSTSSLSSFVPLEGIYGVYNLPCSGPHIVLMTESEEIYTSPLQSSASRDKASNTPLIELRRVKSLEIAPLRAQTTTIRQPLNNGRNDNFQNSKKPQLFSEEQMAEEARQLRLLRNSFKEHDFYFTVPPKHNSTLVPVVQDVTHSLQRSFLEWAVHCQDVINDASDISQSGTKNNDGSKHRWWIPYMEEVMEKNTRQRLVDPRFYWNEQPALAMLRPLLHSMKNAGESEVESSNRKAHKINSYHRNEENSIQSPYALLLDHVLPVTSAFVGVQRDVPIPSSGTHGSSREKYDQLLISRRSKYRTGTRFTRRGADDTGAVANYAETEQICLIIQDHDGANRINKESSSSRGVLKEVYSHVQTRGSIPLHWSSPADVKAYRPRVYIGADPVAQARGLRDHLMSELWWYSSSATCNNGGEDNVFSKQGLSSGEKPRGVKLALVNLIDKHGDQGRLGSAFDSVLMAVLQVYDSTVPDWRQLFKKSKKKQPHLSANDVNHIWYDFHAECKGGRWDRLAQLLEMVTPALDEQGYFCAVPYTSSDLNYEWDIVCLQDGVVRTNCMDCLDRTNVVQSMFGRHLLYRQLYERKGSSKKYGAKQTVLAQSKRMRNLPLECVVGYRQRPLSLPWTEGEAAHRHLWADNADAISRLYAGTPALKGDFTRTGKRTKRGALDDGLNSVQRYLINNFIDADRQEGMDLLVGKSDFNVVSYESDEQTSRAMLLKELSRRGYDKSHVRIKVKSNREHGASGNGADSLSLRWLPGDLRHHMKSEALRSRSPLSSAAEEENIKAEKSSEFLLEVATSAASFEQHLEIDDIEVLHSIDRRASSGRPWWVGSVEENINASVFSSYENGPYGTNQPANVVKISVQSIIGTLRNQAFATTLLFVFKAPVLSAIAIAALIASGFSREF